MLTVVRPKQLFVLTIVLYFKLSFVLSILNFNLLANSLLMTDILAPVSYIALIMLLLTIVNILMSGSVGLAFSLNQCD